MRTAVIYVVEDEYLQALYVIDLLKKKFESQVDVRRISTEHEFRTKFEEIAVSEPFCIIMDVMLQWAKTAVAEHGEEVDSFLEAGLRCRDMLLNDSRTKRIPVIIYT